MGVLGPTNLSLDGVQKHLTPLTVKLLLRLIAAEGEPVCADQIYRDVWETPLTEGSIAGSGMKCKNAFMNGLLKPVAIPLVGSGLARVTELSREQLMIMIVDTFLGNCRNERCSPELRIVIRPSEVARMRMSDVARFVESLDQDGRKPHE